MAEPCRFRLRATYIERDRLAMLSHLEVARALERTVRRAQLPYAISQGFSPHMKIAFGAALPVGVGSTCEIFDLQLTEYVPPLRALEALQRASVPDLMVQKCAYIESSARAASVAFPLSVYEVRFSRPVAAVPVPENVTVVRKRKEKVLHVADFLIEGFSPVAPGAAPAGAVLAGAPGAGAGDAVPAGAPTGAPSDLWRFALEAKESGSLRPDVLLRACLERGTACGIDATCGDVEAGMARGDAARDGDAAASMASGAASVSRAGRGPTSGIAPGGAGGGAAEELRVLSITRVEQRAR